MKGILFTNSVARIHHYNMACNNGAMKSL